MSQTYVDFEAILIDDGSTDKSGFICDEYVKKDARFNVIHKNNEGVSVARNIGLEIAKGDYICFIDSDDFVDNTYIEKLTMCLQENNSDIALARINLINSKGEVKPLEEINLQNFVTNGSIDFLYSNNYPVGGYACRCLFSKKIIKGIVFNPQVKILEDLAFITSTLLKKAKLSLCDEFLYYYTYNENSASRRVSEAYVNNHYNGSVYCAQVLRNNGYEEYAKMVEFETFKVAVHSVAKNNEIELSSLKANEFNTKDRYNIYKLSLRTFFKKIDAYLVRHKMIFLIKLLFKLRGK